MDSEETAMTRLIRGSAAQLHVGEIPLARIERRGRAATFRRTSLVAMGACALALSTGWGVAALVQPGSTNDPDVAGSPTETSPLAAVPPLDRAAVRACVADPRTSGELTMSDRLVPGYPSPEAAARPLIDGPLNLPGGRYRAIDAQEGDVAVEASRDASTANVALMRSTGTLYTVLVTMRDPKGGWHVEGILECRTPGEDQS